MVRLFAMRKYTPRKKVLVFRSHGVYDRAMSNKHHPDAALIANLGDVRGVLALLGWDEKQYTRVLNWKTRGIPWEMKAKRPDLFMPELKRKASKVAA